MSGLPLAVFDQPLLLIVAVLGPIFVVALVAARQRRRKARLARLGRPEIVKRLVPSVSFDAPVRRGILLGGSALCAGLALAGPRWGEEKRLEHGAGVDVVLALDASLSMMARDERPSRLERMKEEVRRLRDLSPGDRTALIAFAGRSYVLTPLTVDDGALDLFLDNLDPSVVGQPGTSLARAIRQATDLLVATKTASDRAMVLMSDGEGFDDEADIRAAAAAAAENSVSVVTVGFGTEAGTTIPLRREPSGLGANPLVSEESRGGVAHAGDTSAVKRDENGDVIVTHYSPQLLRMIADEAHGTFVPATATDKAARIRNALNRLRAAERALERGESRAPRFQLFLIPAVLLLLADTVLADRGRVKRMVATAAMFVVFLQAAPDQRDRSPRALYNYGTTLLATDSLDAAVSALTLVASDRDPEVRYRSLFNLGLAHLRRGLGGSGDAARSELDMALAAYKRVLLMRGADADAKWNYELALQARQSGGGGGGGGGGGNGPAPAPKPSPRPGPPDQGEGQLGKRQAEEILRSAAREERDVEGRKQKQAQTDVPPMGKDW